MQERTLGRTGIDVGEIGLGTEYLHGQSRETVAAVVREAVGAGVSYFDILWPYREYLDNLGAALRGIRDRVTLAVHIGCAETDGQYRRSRDIAECSAVFDDMLSRLGADHADVVMVQWVDDADDYDTVTDPGGMLEVANRLRDAGRTRFVGLSSHAVPTALEAVKSGRFDVLMFPINPAVDSLGGGLESVSLGQASAPHGEPAIAAGRRHLYETCAAEGMGLVAMKPFAGGRFFEEDAGPEAGLGPVQLLSYALSQPGVSVAVPGAKNPAEMRAVLDYLSATQESKDFSSALAGYTWIAEGTCVYCNHCLPCPSGIDIGRTLRLAASAERTMSPGLRAEYDALPAPASDCIECGDCAERCPFGVDVVERVRSAARLFEG